MLIPDLKGPWKLTRKWVSKKPSKTITAIKFTLTIIEKLFT